MGEALDTVPIRSRCERATEGPWEAEEDWCDCGGDYPCVHGSFATYLVAPAKQVIPYPNTQPNSKEPAQLASFVEGRDCTDGDVDFIVHARTDVPQLLDEIDRLRAALETAESACAGYRETIGAQAATILRLARIEKAAKAPLVGDAVYAAIASIAERAGRAHIDHVDRLAYEAITLKGFLEAIGERP